jgi:putative DNA-invertase from lambdoid prophage Rac
MKAAVYLRVSSRDGRQDEENQEPDCRRLCEARGWEPVIYRERESGVKERPVWRSVLEAARTGQVRAVVVWALDRIGRTRVQVAHDLAELLRWRVDVVSVRDPWLDQAGPMRELLVQVMAWVAEGERQRLIERTHAGLARARAKGIKLGRKPSIPQPVVMRALWIRATGVPWSEVVRQLAAEGLGKYSLGGIERAVTRLDPEPSQKGSENGPEKPARQAGSGPPGGTFSN